MDAIQQKVISLLEGLSARFPSMSFTYGYDAAASQHLVNVEPTGLYKSESYKLAEADVYDAWDAVYPEYDLVFVSNNLHHQITHPLFSIKGNVEVPINQSIEPICEPLLITSDAPRPTMLATDMYGWLEANGSKVLFGHPAIAQPIVSYDGEMNEMEAGEYGYVMAA